ncbi:hypothetical protein DFQ26_005710 [Actinomortierella ambigua]|nr:hypothetical protein DFQ26_005710 [Actinomortierella ambigua]
MLARTYITYVAVAAIALVSVVRAAPAVNPEAPNLDSVRKLEAVAQEIEGPATLPVPKELFPLCCIRKIEPCSSVVSKQIFDEFWRVVQS